MKLIGILQLYIYNDLYIYIIINYLYPIEISHCWDIIPILSILVDNSWGLLLQTNWGQPVDRVLLVCCLRLEQRPFRQAFCAATERNHMKGWRKNDGNLKNKTPSSSQIKICPLKIGIFLTKYILYVSVYSSTYISRIHVVCIWMQK